MTKLGDIPLYREVSAADVVEQLDLRAAPDSANGPYPKEYSLPGPRSGTMLIVAQGTSWYTASGARAASCIPYRSVKPSVYPTYYNNFGELFFNLGTSHELHNLCSVLVTTNPGDESVPLLLAYNIFSGNSGTDDYWGACVIVSEDGRSTT